MLLWIASIRDSAGNRRKEVSYEKKKKIRTVVITIITLFLLLVSLFPFYYMVVQSILPWDRIDKEVLPVGFTLRSYEYLMTTGGSGKSLMWVRALLNSLIVSLPTAIISVVCGLLIGYAVTKLAKFNGKKFIMDTLLFQMFFPAIILLCRSL